MSRWSRLAEAARDVVLRTVIGWVGEQLLGIAELDKLAEIHEGRALRYAGGLLHVVRDDGDRELVFQLIDQLFDLGRRNGIERRARLVEKDHLGTDRNRARDAKPLLLAAGQAQAAAVQLVLDFAPQSAPSAAPSRPVPSISDFGSRS